MKTLLDFMKRPKKEWAERSIQDTSRRLINYIHKMKFGVKTLYGRIVQLLEQNPDGLSINEIGSLLGIQYSTISARIHELRKKGVIMYHEERDSSVSGQRNNIWKLVPNHNKVIELLED